MDAFESLVGRLLGNLGYWTRQSYKINLPKDDKKALDKPSLPRPEIDILAYRPANNTLLWVECKSYLDSPGVGIDSLTGKSQKGAERYKIFTNTQYREVVSRQLIKQTVDEGLALPNPCMEYCLVAGHIKPGSRGRLHEHFAQHGWRLYDDIWLRDELTKLASIGYENDTATMVAKLFLKNSS